MLEERSVETLQTQMELPVVSLVFLDAGGIYLIIRVKALEITGVLSSLHDVSVIVVT
jgi:hypothetical protein